MTIHLQPVDFPTSLNQMSDDEKRLLLFFESSAVNCGGAINVLKMNGEDRKVRDRWVDSGFIEYGRITHNTWPADGVTNWVKLSDPAWCLAHEQRMTSFEEREASRGWMKANEKL